MAESNATELSVVTLLLVGKTGNGKSSTANTILQAGTIPNDGQTPTDKTPFTLAHSFNSATTTVEWKECVIDGRKIRIIKTPDLANPMRTADGNVIVKISEDGNDSKSGIQDKKAEKAVSVDEWVELEKDTGSNIATESLPPSSSSFGATGATLRRTTNFARRQYALEHNNPSGEITEVPF